MTKLDDVLKHVSPRRAFFTSYTFSAVWFESCILPLLSCNYCESITVMLDAREARQSVDNSTSRYGGTRYRVIATTVDNGIFHPKIAYLEAEDGDVLVVSSANLTGHGQGSSLEVIDTIQASDEPEVFAEIAEFFKKLPLRVASIATYDLEILESFARRARAQADHFASSRKGPRNAWLVTTLSGTAESQLVTLAQRFLKKSDTLTVLSPYFDKKLDAVVSLQKKLASPSLRFGLERRSGRLIAPFERKSIKNSEVRLHLVEPPGNTRRLHAKWFEVSDVSGRALVMTGSVNATWKSMCTSHNIEVSLARLLPASTTQGWTATEEEPDFLPCEFPVPLAGEQCITCVAHLTFAGDLEVQFAGLTDTVITAALLHDSKCVLSTKMTVNSKGQGNRTVAREVLEKVDAGAIWFVATGSDFELSTWVNVESRLHMKPAQADIFKAVRQLGADIYDEDDVFLLFDSASYLLTQKRLPRSGPSVNRRTRQEIAQQNELMTEAEWLASIGEGTGGRLSGEGQVHRIFGEIIKLLDMDAEELEQRILQNEFPDETPAGAEDSDTDSDADSDGDGSARRRGPIGRSSLKEELAKARQHLRTAIEKSVKLPMRDELAEIVIPQRIRDRLSDVLTPSLRKVDVGSEPLAEALHEHVVEEMLGVISFVVELKCSSKVVETALPMVVSVAAVLALCMERRRFAVPYERFRSLLEDFSRRKADGSALGGMLKGEWSRGRLPRLHYFELTALESQVDKIAQAPSAHDCIASLINMASESSRAMGNPRLDELLKVLRSALGRRYKLYSVLVADELVKGQGCPMCDAAISEAELRQLRATHMMLCKNTCQRPIFWRRLADEAKRFPREDEASVVVREHRPTGKKGTS